ncbi:hypothetical protein TRVL_06911 [Trypanosoma vivax]|nr:hypothetical protein TRVL_06911 [Trypanosoma vivax]
MHLCAARICLVLSLANLSPWARPLHCVPYVVSCLRSSMFVDVFRLHFFFFFPQCATLRVVSRLLPRRSVRCSMRRSVLATWFFARLTYVCVRVADACVSFAHPTLQLFVPTCRPWHMCFCAVLSLGRGRSPL